MKTDNVIHPSGSMFVPVTGSGGGGKSGKSSGATEAPNTLQSTAIAMVADLIGEGEIKGLVTGDEQSILLNKVQVKNPDGSFNYTGYSYAMNNGTSDQVSLPNFTNVSNEITVQRLVRADTPVVYPTTANNLDAIVVTMNIPALTHADSKNGNLNGYEIDITVEVKSLANSKAQWYEVDFGSALKISGKCTSPYERSYRINVDNTQGPWLVRVKKTSGDHDSDVTITDKIYIGHVTEIIEHKIAYSNSAVIGHSVDAAQFDGSIATREVDVYGRLMLYPSNWNPTTRAYTGLWDGTFKYGYCDNPAWVLYDCATDPRAGADIDPLYTDKWGLYEVAKYCDALVPDGQDGMEPRFVYAGIIKDQEDAYKVLQTIASMMRSLLFYGAGAVIIRADMPSTPTRIFTPANISGYFNYVGTALKVQHNAAVVQWVNPDLGYDTDYTSYEDQAAIIKYGYNPLSLTTVGTTKRSQAYRQGKWAVLTEQSQRDTVNFSTGADAGDVLPGDIVEIADPHFATADFAGRIRQPTGANLLTSTTCNIAKWSVQGGTIDVARYAGPLGPSNLVHYTANSNNPHTLNAPCPALNSGATYTVSGFIRRGSARYMGLAVLNNVAVAYDTLTGNVSQRVGSANATFVSSTLQDWGTGLFRITLSFHVNTSNTPTLYMFQDGPNNASVSTIAPNVAGLSGFVSTDDFYAGTPQIEQAAVATDPYPVLTADSKTIFLDRDIEFAGAPNPNIHLTLVSGVYDDFADISDNTNRPARREISWFSSAVTSYAPETQVITLSTAIPLGGNDGATPIIWVFSNDNIEPVPFKVVSTAETDGKPGEYSITAIEYSNDKFNALDEGYNLPPDGNYSDLPSTRYCSPPSDLIVKPTTVAKNGTLTTAFVASWTASTDQFLAGYMFSYRQGVSNWVNMPMTPNQSVDLSSLAADDYEFKVCAINRFGVASAFLDITATIGGNTTGGGALQVINVVSDRGDSTFTDRDLHITWTSNAYTAAAQTNDITAQVIRGGGGTVTGNGDNVTAPAPKNTSPGATVDVNLGTPTAPVITLGGTYTADDVLTVTIGSSTFQVVGKAGYALADFAAAITTYIDADGRFTCANNGGVLTLGFVPGATNASGQAAHTDPTFLQFVVQIKDPNTLVTYRTIYTEDPSYTYTYSLNQQDFINPSRSVLVAVAVQDIYGNTSAYSKTTFTNAPPVPSPVTFNITSSGVSLLFNPPQDPDYAGIEVWMSQTSGFTQSASTLVYHDRGNPSIPLQPGQTYYLKYGFYDAFGDAGIAISAQVQIVTPPLTTASFDNTPPAVPGKPVLSTVVGIDPVTGQPQVKLHVAYAGVGDSDLGSYEVGIVEGTGGEVDGFYAPANQTFIEVIAKAATTYKAHVRAADHIGNVSGWSAFSDSYKTTGDTTPPAAPTNLTATASLSTIFLAWQNASDLDLDEVEIWETPTNKQPDPVANLAYRIATVNAAPSAVGGYTRGIGTAKTNYYWLRSVDTSGNASGFNSTTGTIGTTASISAADFTPGLSPIATVTTLPSAAGYSGPNVIFNQADGKQYRYVNGAFTSSVATVDLSGVIPGTQISAASITATQIAAGTILAANIAAGTITGDRLMVGTIQTAQIAAGAITTSKLGILGDSLFPDSQIQDLAWWSTNPTGKGAGAIINQGSYGLTWYQSIGGDNSTYAGGANGWRLGAATGNTASDRVILTTPVIAGITGGSYYNFRFTFTNLNVDQYVGGTVNWFDANGAVLPANGLATIYPGTKLAVDVQIQAPATAAFYQLYWFNQGGTTGGLNTVVGGITVRQAGTGQLIVDGTITGAKIVAGSITGDRIQAGSISTDRLSSTGSLPASLVIGTTGYSLSVLQQGVASGSNGANLLPYSDFPAGLGGWQIGYNPGNVGLTAYGINNDAGKNYIVWQWNDTDASKPVSILSNKFNVTGNSIVYIGAYFQAANANIQAVYRAYDSTGTLVQSEQFGYFSVGQLGFPTNGASWEQCRYGNFYALPPTASTMSLEFYALPQTTGQVTAYFTNPMVITCSAGQSIPPSYVPGPNPDAAAVINANTTQINPGNILIAGATTLANWRDGGDNTKIAGGQLSTNSVTANKLTIGNRGINVIDVSFQVSADRNTLYWSAGYVQYYDNSGTFQQITLPAGSCSNAGYNYIYWTQGAGVLGQTTNNAIAGNDSYIVFATWSQGAAFATITYGATIIDGARITSGSITAGQIAANSITGQQIAAGSITAQSLSVAQLSAITGDIGTIRAGILISQNGQTTLDLNNNRIIFNNGSVMRVEGTGFGTRNQFVTWFGPSMDPSQCSETNAISYERNDGSAYFGGSLSAGVLKNAVQTSSTAANASVDTGPFGSNGHTRQVVLSYNYIAHYTIPAGSRGSYSGTTNASIILRNGAGVTLATLNVDGSGNTTLDQADNTDPGAIDETMAGSLTFTDTSGGTSSEYSAVIVSRNIITASGTNGLSLSQRVAIISTEN